MSTKPKPRSKTRSKSEIPGYLLDGLEPVKVDHAGVTRGVSVSIQIATLAVLCRHRGVDRGLSAPSLNCAINTSKLSRSLNTHRNSASRALLALESQGRISPILGGWAISPEVAD